MTPYLEQFNHQIQGPESGRKWVFLHGLMGYGSNWKTIINKLGSSERTLIFDQRGHGRTRMKPHTGYSCEDYAIDIKKILDELGWLENVHLVGHSMGGRNALIFASHYPDYLKSVTIEDMGPDPDPDRVLYFEKLFRCIPTPFESRQKAKDYFMNDFQKTPFARKMGPTLGSYLYSNLEEKDAKNDKSSQWLDWRFAKDGILETVRVGRGKNCWTEYESIPVPILVIRGQNSDELKSSTFHEMIKRNAKAKGVEINDAGHWVHYDQPEAFIQHLLTFVQNLG